MRVGWPYRVLRADSRLGGEIEAIHRRARGQRRAHGIVRLLAQGDRTPHRALGSDIARELASVDVGIRGLERRRRGAGEPGAVLEEHVGGVTVSDGAVDSGSRVGGEAVCSAAFALPGAGEAWAARGPARGRLP